MKKTGAFVVNKVATQRLGVKEVTVELDLEEALDLAGVGKYQIWHSAIMLATLTAAVIEMIGNAFILPAAACDLNLDESLRGIVTSVPNIGIILTTPIWGRAADSWGRKPALLVSSAASGLIGFTAAFMPDLLSYALCKFAGSLFLACPASLGFAYAGELVPRKRRDIVVLMLNGFLMLLSVCSPVFAWGILSNDWRFKLWSLDLRPWRLLTAVYATPLILSAIWMVQAKESPKFLMAKHKHLKALDVLKHIYSKNTGQAPEDYYVTSLKISSGEGKMDLEREGSRMELTPKARSESALALLRPPHLKWLALTGFLMFGLFSLLNGLFLFSPDTINKVMTESTQEEGTVCILMNHGEPANKTSTGECVDTMSEDTFLITAVSTLVYALVVMAASMCPVSKKTLLVATFATSGAACLMSGLLTNRMIAGSAMSALQMTAMGIGPLTAYAVHLFPTSIRGTAVAAVHMFGRVGSVVGANAAGYFLAVACTATFYGFTALLLVCAGLSFFLPGDNHAESTSNSCHFNRDSR